MMFDTCKWDGTRSKCVFKYLNSYIGSKQVSKPIANDPKPSGLTDLVDPCRRKLFFYFFFI